MLTINCLNLGCNAACFLSRLPSGLLRVFNASVPSFSNGSTITTTKGVIGFEGFTVIQEQTTKGQREINESNNVKENEDESSVIDWVSWGRRGGGHCQLQMMNRWSKSQKWTSNLGSREQIFENFRFANWSVGPTPTRRSETRWLFIRLVDALFLNPVWSHYKMAMGDLLFIRIILVHFFYFVLISFILFGVQSIT